MKLHIETDDANITPVEDEELLDAAREIAAFVLGEIEAEEDYDDEGLDEDETPVCAQGALTHLDRWSMWRAQLAVACAEACGCVAYLDDSADQLGAGVTIALAGIAEDADATRRAYARLERRVKRAVERECDGKSEEWTERWAAEHVEGLEEDVDAEADAALVRAHRRRVKGTTLVWDPEAEPEERAEVARAWLLSELGVDEVSVVPHAPPAPGVVDLATYAGRRSV